jgi:hypothetical protein
MVEKLFLGVVAGFEPIVEIALGRFLVIVANEKTRAIVEVSVVRSSFLV